MPGARRALLRNPGKEFFVVTAFDLYFASFVAMTLHPGAGMKEHHALSLIECAELAQRCCELRKEYVCQLSVVQ